MPRWPQMLTRGMQWIAVVFASNALLQYRLAVITSIPTRALTYPSTDIGVTGRAVPARVELRKLPAELTEFQSKLPRKFPTIMDRPKVPAELPELPELPEGPEGELQASTLAFFCSPKRCTT